MLLMFILNVMLFVCACDVLHKQSYSSPCKPEAAPSAAADEGRVETLWLVRYSGQIP